ncbi:MAG TPA: hypothetical protein VN538_04020 [Clostridia bacterium]|nr:hypothetical protein [Clostridia bacterium]
MNPYDRANQIFDRYVWPLMVMAFIALIAFNAYRAWLHYDDWKWQVLP